ncbi:MAG: DUF3307 domain-containing protein [Rhodobacteraceae bacterium]|nr:DUF3307 domain-containing protein [Paracoccaceae bacterium]
MTGELTAALVLLCLLQIKHMFADYFLQTQKMLSGRNAYLHLGRAQHAAVHAVLSAVVLVAVGAGWGFVVLLVLAEWVVHFNIDYAKARYSEARGHTPAMAGFWRAAGVDQALHQLTYVAMIWAHAVYA